MIAVITKPYFYTDIEKAAADQGVEIIFRESADIISQTDLFEVLNKISLLSVKILVIDISVCKDSVIRLLRGYRIKRGDTRIIVIAPDMEPGNKILHNIVSMGIYDILIPGEEGISQTLQNMIENPSAYSMAVRFLLDDDSKGYGAKAWTKKETSKEFVKEVVEKEIVIKELDTAVITLISNDTTGKTHTAWNLSYCMAERGYQTSVLNLDRGYSANLYYGIEDIYYGILDKIIETEEYKSILEYCYKRKNLNVITGRLGSMEDISIEAFSKLLFYIRSKSDMTIIDTKTGMSELTAAAVENATIVLMVFDSDLMHFHLNKMMIESLGDLFIPERTIALINDCDIESASYKFIHEQIKSLGLPFKAILSVSSCMTLGCDMMHTDKTAYQAAEEKHGQFKEDMDSLMKSLNAKQKRNFLQKLFRFGKDR